MFKNRPFMLGLGIGIITGALLLQLMLLAQTGRSEPTTAAVDSVSGSAQNSGGGAPAEEDPAAVEGDEPESENETAEPEQPETQAPSEPVSQAAEEPDASSVPSVSEPETEIAQEPQAPASSDAQAPSAPEAPAKASSGESAQAPKVPTEPAAQSSIVSVDIQRGMNLKDVAEALERAGVVKDSAEFQRQADKEGVSAKLQIGSYTFQPGSSYTNIIKELSTPKEN